MLANPRRLLIRIPWRGGDRPSTSRRPAPPAVAGQPQRPSTRPATTSSMSPGRYRVLQRLLRLAVRQAPPGRTAPQRRGQAGPQALQFRQDQPTGPTDEMGIRALQVAEPARLLR
jgi:hypothetical protein